MLLPLDTEKDGFRASQTGQQEPSVYSPAEAAGYVAVFSQRPVRGSGCESRLRKGFTEEPLAFCC